MHVIILLLILILICYLIANWQITLPIGLFLIYLCSIAAREKNAKGKWRFHIFWWIFQLMVICGIVYGEKIVDFLDDFITEYDHRYDPMVSRGITVIDYDSLHNVELSDSLEARDGKHIFGGLEVGMSPFNVFIHVKRMGGMDDFNIGNVYFNYVRRHYYNNDLYGISMSFNDFNDYTRAETLLAFLKQKYGNPHLYTKDEYSYKSEWHLKYKHIVIESKGGHYSGNLYIYQPEMLAGKIKEENQKEQKRRDKLLKKKQKEAEKLKLELQKEIEKSRKKEEKNRLLQNGL